MTRMSARYVAKVGMTTQWVYEMQYDTGLLKNKCND